jgi:hypothetical protein
MQGLEMFPQTSPDASFVAACHYRYTGESVPCKEPHLVPAFHWSSPANPPPEGEPDWLNQLQQRTYISFLGLPIPGRDMPRCGS